MDDPHGGRPIASAGTDIDGATAAVVAVHGRGATARSVLDLAGEFDVPGVAYLAPRAAGNEWYPRSFMAPIDANQPSLASALGAVDRALARATEAEIPPERVVLLGFSQGACLATEYAVRNARRYGGVVAFSGGLIGPEGTTWEYDGDLAGTPAFLGCSDVDPHIPVERVDETAAVLEEMGADVEKRLYEGMGHTVNRDELDYAAGMVEDLVRR